MLSTMSEYILIGKVTTVHGVKGAVKVISFAENPEDIFKYKIFNKDCEIINLKKIGILSNGLFISQINDINDRNEAEKLRNLELFINKSELKVLNNDEFYIDELIGMKVDSSGKLGKINNIYNYGAGNIMEIVWEDKKNTDIPFAEPYVKNVDRKNKTVYIELPEYI